jgi:arylsulfatase A-like enzyme
MLSLAGIEIPGSVEGEDLSPLVLHKNPEPDRAALIMSVAPFAGYVSGKEFRGIRTARYTYVRSINGPWLMYDNQVDPYQMTNLVNVPEHAGLQKTLEQQLQFELMKTGDKFLPRNHYLQKWGYEVDKRGCIPYKGKPKVQSPRKSPG